MTSTELNTFRRRLVRMTRRLGSESEHLRDEVLGDERDSEVSITQEQYTTDDLSREKAVEEVALATLNNEESLLGECLAALQRIEGGTFGRCVTCGHAIAAARLEAAPYVRDCIRCARKAESKSE
jgi:DnaK suppressor protein